MSWDRTLIGRAGYYIRIDVNPQNDLEVLIANCELPPFARRRRDVPDHGRRLRRLPRHLDRSAQSRALGRDGRRRRGHHAQSRPDLHAIHAADRTDVSRRDRRPGAVLDLQQPPGRRHDARAEQRAGAGDERADRSYAARGGVVVAAADGAGAAAAACAAVAGGGGGAGPPAVATVPRPGTRGRTGSPPDTTVAAMHFRRRGGGGGGGGGGRAGGAAAAMCGKQTSAAANRASRFPTPGNPDIIWATCYGNTVTRFDAQSRPRASVSPWYPHARLRAEQGEVPLPLDAAARDRSVRSEHGVLRLPGDLQDVERRPELDA